MKPYLIFIIQNQEGYCLLWYVIHIISPLFGCLLVVCSFVRGVCFIVLTMIIR